MEGNSFGRCLRMTAWGESHQKAVGVVLDGLPSGLKLKLEEIQEEVDLRRPGQSEISTPRKEEDRVEILSGLFQGKTTGSPLSMLVYNRDVDSKPYEKIKNIMRPGHADYTYRLKYGFHDYRGGGRSSGRETVSRVMAGAVAKKLLKHPGIKVIAHTTQIADVSLEKTPSIKEIERNSRSNPVRCSDPETADLMMKRIQEIAGAGDSSGGIVDVVALGVPPGLGDPVYNKLDAVLAKALISIPAVKGVEFGAGFKSPDMRGSQMNDPYRITNGKVVFESNNSGGILGGISTGMPLIARIAVKPTSSISVKQKTVDVGRMEEVDLGIEGRHDPNITPRVVPVAEAMTAFVLADYCIAGGLIPPRFPK
ncbi:MAG: chorismate synthase [Candidatus Altiarchaeales archaeon ex4484_2]|nr:MAG: chorismate synthase [Candidatus Altiarchaeales archaeon ex4484_2]